jgi:hypothetical protein
MVLEVAFKGSPVLAKMLSISSGNSKLSEDEQQFVCLLGAVLCSLDQRVDHQPMWISSPCSSAREDVMGTSKHLWMSEKSNLKTQCMVKMAIPL